MVYSSGSAVRDDVIRPGTWAFAPARLSDGSVVVINRRLCAEHHAGSCPAGPRGSSARDGAPLRLTGYSRFPEPPGRIHAPGRCARKRLWFSRDHVPMSQALGWASVARRSISILKAPFLPSGVPKPGPAARPSQGRSPAICGHLVRSRVGGCRRRLASGPRGQPARVRECGAHAPPASL